MSEEFTAKFCLDVAPVSGFTQSGHSKIYVCEEPKGHEGRHRASFNLEDGRHATLEWDRVTPKNE